MQLKLRLQHDETDCAAACLGMILEYYGREVNIRKLRTVAGTDMQGTSGYGIKLCAEKFGLSCKGFAIPEKNRLNEIPMPAIFHTRKDSQEHYVVVESVKKGFVRIFDPAEGIVKMPLSDFISIWTGIVFLCCPSERFIKEKEDKSPIVKFFSLLKPHKLLLSKIIVASMILTIFGILISFYFRFLIDEVLYSEVKATLNICSIGYLCILIFQGFLSYARNQIILYLGTKIDVCLVCDFFCHLLKLPLDFFTSRKTGEVLSRIRDTETIRYTISSTTVSVLIDTIMIIFGSLFLFKMGSNLLYISMIPIVISAGIVWGIARPLKQLIKNRSIAEAEKNASMYETINGIATIKALSTEKNAFRRNEARIVEAINRCVRLETFGNINNAVQTFISSVGTLLVYWIGSYKIFNGEMSLGQLISFVTLSGFFLGPLSRLLTMQPNLQEAFVAAERLSDIMDIAEEDEKESGNDEVSKMEKEIVFDKVCFSYGTRGRAIDEINLKIEKGKKIAFVGKSGSGKSTILKLLMKFYETEDGSILLDGKNIRDLKTSDYRELIGYVPQESLLFSGTIGENIAWGMDCVTNEMIEAAAKAAQAYDFIMALPDKFRTVVGEHGATLSGGERQRIALARILMRNPEIIVLDEATASLDSISEKAIMETVNSFHDRTIIMVAHRLSTICGCDKIYVLDNGKIVEEGNHEELLKMNGKYKELWSAQYEK
ncbi:MAG: peptidase domain-containing ABC transporter [Treponema sp.]|nr:peptidase domain-containing ABC transporter [Treponema sp.]